MEDKNMAQLQFFVVTYQEFLDDEKGQLSFEQKNKYFSIENYAKARGLFEQKYAEMCKYVDPDEAFYEITKVDGKDYTTAYSDFAVGLMGCGTHLFLPVTLELEKAA